MPEQPRARLISNATLWHLHQAQGRVEELREWARANNLTPADVSADNNITIEDGPDGRVIRCHVFVRNDAGAKTESSGGGPNIEECTVPLVVEPPESWPVYAVPGPA
jgi:hypothetical protein